MKRKVICFDWDGVLADSYHLHWPYRKACSPTMTFRDFQKIHDGNYWKHIGSTGHQELPVSPEEFQTRFQNYLEAIKTVKLFPGAADFIHDISKNHTITLNTSCYEEPVVACLNHHGIRSGFSFIGGKETHASKVEKFKMICMQFGIQPSELIFVTDTRGDALEAHELGIPTIVVTWGLHGVKRLRNSPHAHMAHSVKGLKKIIEQL